jgi:hypothetical protein
MYLGEMADAHNQELWNNMQVGTTRQLW